MFGYVSWWRAWSRAFARNLGEDMKVIATGGLSEIVANANTEVDPNHRALVDPGRAAHAVGDEPVNTMPQSAIDQ